MSNNKVIILDGNFLPYDDSNPLPIEITNIGDLPGGSGSISISGTPVDNQLAVWTDSSTVEGESWLTFDKATGYFTYTALTDDNSLLIQPSTTSGLVNSPYFAMRTYSTGAPLDFNFHATRTGATTYTFEITDTNGTPVSTWTHTGNLDVPGTITGSQLISDVATGTAPLSVTSTTKVSNLNVDAVDGVNVATLTNGRLIRYNSTGTQLENATVTESSGALGGVTDITMTGRLKGTTLPADFTIINPNGAYAVDTQIPLFYVDAALTITKIEVSLNTTAQNVAGDLKYADNLTSFTNAVVINDFDTTSGVRSDTSITSGSVAAGKWVYLDFDSQPNSAITFMIIHIEGDYD